MELPPTWGEWSGVKHGFLEEADYVSQMSRFLDSLDDKGHSAREHSRWKGLAASDSSDSSPLAVLDRTWECVLRLGLSPVKSWRLWSSKVSWSLLEMLSEVERTGPSVLPVSSGRGLLAEVC